MTLMTWSRLSIVTDNNYPTAARPTIRGLLHDAWLKLDRRMIELRAGTGLDVVRPADANLFMSICRNPRTVSDLARDRGVTRQSIHSAVHRLVEAGALRLDPIPGNLRDKLPVPTEMGLEARRKAQALVDEMEQELAEKLGREKLETLRGLLRELSEVTFS